MTTNAIIKELKNDNQDFEFYPTTDEIIDTIHNDLLNFAKTNNKTIDYQERKESVLFGLKQLDDFYFNWDYNRETEIYEYHYRLESFIDIGAGDGRLFDKIVASKKYAVEKSLAQADRLIKNNIMLLGHDFFETTLIDKTFTVVFCNPPYSIYKDFVKRILSEVNGVMTYLVIPSSWQNDVELNIKMKKKGQIDILGQFDFLDADRKARAKVDLIRIVTRNAEDSFREWVEENIGQFKADETINLKDFSDDSTVNKAIQERKENLVEIMVDSYNKELAELLNTYKAIGSINFSLFLSLGISKQFILDKIKDDIKTLKNKYWTKTIGLLDEVSKRLTYKKRQQILTEIKWFTQLDFNALNIRTIVLWIIENHNKFTKEQMMSVYDDITDKESVSAYKSNDKWETDKWRYAKPIPTKYFLDYRIVVPLHIKGSGYSSKYDYLYNNTIRDLCTVANSLGFTVKEFPSQEYQYAEKEKHEVKTLTDEILFEYTLHYNGNCHFKLNQKFLKTLNIEVGKLRGWLKSPSDIEDEFDLSKEEAEKFFVNENYLLQLGKMNLLQIEA